MSNPLLELMRQGESGAAGYNAYNRGTYTAADGEQRIRGSNGAIDFSAFTLGQLQDMQHLGRQDPDRIFAVGKYQIIPSTMDRAVEVLGLDRSQRFTPELQDRIFSEFLIVGKRPAIHDYIVGTPGASLEAAQRGLAMEWASFGHPDKGGRSYYGGANHASITLDQSAQALEQMRAGYRERIERGVAPTEAWKQVTASDAAAVDRNGRGVVAAAMADGVLRMGERGDEVRSLQTALNQAGHTDDRGRRLAEDGVFGSSTRESVESFQRAMELKVDGVAGSRTLESLRAAVPSAASPEPGGAGGRSFEDTMRIMLPPQGAVAPHVTGHFAEDRGNRTHGGVDFNYVGGQNGVNLRHPTIHSPVSGEVTFVGGSFGTIKIRDAEGNSHELLHTNTQSVRVGQQVSAGDAIGTMGGRGPGGADDYAQHVHYQLKDGNGRLMNPQEYWNLQPAHSSPRPADSSGDGARTTGSVSSRHGPGPEDTRQLQQALNQYGYRDAAGRALQADGQLGDRTGEAIRAYQQAHGLKADGVVGPQTLEALSRSQQTPLLSDARHPDHGMFQQAVRGLEQLDNSAFRSRQELENAAAATVFEAKASGLTRIDSVVASTNGTGLFAVQGRMEDPSHSRVHLDKAQAAHQPIEKSTVQVQQDTMDASRLQQEREQQQRRVMVA